MRKNDVSEATEAGDFCLEYGGWWKTGLEGAKLGEKQEINLCG